MHTMTSALMTAIDRAAALATAALALISCRPPDTGLAVLGAAIREQLLALRADADLIGRVWDESAAAARAQARAEMAAEVRVAFAAGRAFEAGLASAPVIPMLLLGGGGDAPAGPRPGIRLVSPAAPPPR